MAENPAAPAAPMSEEDQYAAAVESDRAARAEADAAKTPAGGGAAPANAEARPTPGVDAPRARDPATGKFLPTGAAGGEPAEPFPGFKDLSPDARAYFDKLQNDTKQAQNRAAAAQRDSEARRRAAAPPQRPRAPAPQPQPPKPVAPRAMPKWEAGKAEYPDFFATLEERFAAAEEAAGGKLTAIEARQLELDQRLQETRQIADRFLAREEQAHKATIRDVLDKSSPEWRRTVGWVDADGNTVPDDAQVLAPEFQSWLDALPPKVRAIRQAEMADDDPDVVASVFVRFDADYREFLAFHGQADPRGNIATPARNPVDVRREQAQNDRQPRPNAGPPRREPAPAPADRVQSRFDAEEAAYVAANSPENRERWRGLRT